LKSSPKSAARALLHVSGVTAALRRWSQHNLRILMYHRFPPGSHLEAQCEHLRRHYRPVSLTEAAASFEGRNAIPGAVVVTVDDGYRDFLVNAWPIFKAYSIPALVYVATDLPDQKTWLWTDQLARFLRDRGEAEATAIKDRIKEMPDDERRAYLKSLDGLSPIPPPEFQPLSWDEIRSLAREGVEFGAHTRSHPILSRLPNRERMRQEIAGSKERLEVELGAPVLHFCYPNGTPADYNDDVIAVVREAGFHTAVTAVRGMNRPGENAYLLRRLHQEPTREPEQFAHQVAGLYRS
jgi:peptidoglycan/xylan/chitin deacetylase (PgdA/CDA1 family)